MTYLEAIILLERSGIVITNERVAFLSKKTVRAFVIWKSRHRDQLKGVAIIDRVTLRRRHQIQRLIWQAHMQTQSGCMYMPPRMTTLQAGLGVSRSTAGRLLRKEPRLRTLLRV